MRGNSRTRWITALMTSASALAFAPQMVLQETDGGHGGTVRVAPLVPSSVDVRVVQDTTTRDLRRADSSRAPQDTARIHRDTTTKKSTLDSTRLRDTSRTR